LPHLHPSSEGVLNGGLKNISDEVQSYYLRLIFPLKSPLIFSRGGLFLQPLDQHPGAKEQSPIIGYESYIELVAIKPSEVYVHAKFSSAASIVRYNFL
jgi:hypothetical protein